MLTYNTRIALKSLRRHPLLTAIVIAGIALGICASTTFTTVRHMYARDPLPGRSDRLFYIRLDNWDPARPYPAGDGTTKRPQVPPQITYRDAVELLRSKIPLRNSAAYVTTLPIFPEKSVSRPYTDNVRLCTSDFFPMFELPFRYGQPWDHRADAKAEQVVVLSDAANQKIFGGGNSVGKRVRIADRQFTVVGVLKPWHPFIRMYDMNGNFSAEPEPIYAPFSLTPGMELRSTGNYDNWKQLGVPNPTYQQILYSEADFVQLWVELRSPSDRAQYQRFLELKPSSKQASNGKSSPVFHQALRRRRLD